VEVLQVAGFALAFMVLMALLAHATAWTRQTPASVNAIVADRYAQGVVSSMADSTTKSSKFSLTTNRAGIEFLPTETRPCAGGSKLQSKGGRSPRGKVGIRRFCALGAILLLSSVSVSAQIRIEAGTSDRSSKGTQADLQLAKTTQATPEIPHANLAVQAAPELPQVNVASFPPETREQLETAYAAARKNSRDASAVGRLGMLLDLYHRPAEAAAYYQRAHSIEPRTFAWLYYWGSLLLNQQRMEEAVGVLSSAVDSEPEYVPARLKLGEALVETGKIDAAKEIYEGILKDHPDAAEAYYGLGRVQAVRGDQAAAAENYRKACEIFPNYGAAHYGLAMAYRKLGHTAEAQEQATLHDRNRYIVPPSLDPLRDELRRLDLSAAAHLERGVQLEEVGRYEDAITETEKALELDPLLIKAHVNLLILYARTGNAEKAKQHYEAVVATDPEQFPEAYYNYGVLLMKENNLAEAEAAFRKAVALAPSNEAAHSNLGYLLEHEGKLPESAAEFRKLIELRPNSRQAHFELGRIFVNLQQYDEAIQEFQQTLTPRDENTPAYLYAMGAAYGRAGDSAHALDYLKQAKDLAAAHGQAALVAEIERDLERVGGL
jgi:tetratricopeptide (TPR) repeat protein